MIDPPVFRNPPKKHLLPHQRKIPQGIPKNNYHRRALDIRKKNIMEKKKKKSNYN